MSAADDETKRIAPLIGLPAGPLAFLLLLVLPAPAGLAPAAGAVAATVTLMVIWWITEALPVAATALVPIVVFPLLDVVSIADAAAPYANPLIFLFLGGFLIAKPSNAGTCTAESP
jgi:solute carrier family 13 (sodium-dependent dicarboxylate transporter), member 2/3/5